MEDRDLFPPDLRITTEILIRGALLFAAIDAVLVPVACWRISAAAFRQMKWDLAVVNALFYGSIWLWAVSTFWESVYGHLFPGWARWVLPFYQLALTALVSLAAWALARRARISPAAAWCLLGGLWGVLTHLLAVSLGIVTKPPILRGAAPAAAVFIALFEFMAYWTLTLTLARGLHAARRWAAGRLHLDGDLFAFFALAYLYSWVIEIPLGLSVRGAIPVRIPPALH